MFNFNHKCHECIICYLKCRFMGKHVTGLVLKDLFEKMTCSFKYLTSKTLSLESFLILFFYFDKFCFQNVKKCGNKQETWDFQKLYNSDIIYYRHLLPHMARSIVQTAIDPIFPPRKPRKGDTWFTKISWCTLVAMETLYYIMSCHVIGI
jgi:hypothetical protein